MRRMGREPSDRRCCDSGQATTTDSTGEANGPSSTSDATNGSAATDALAGLMARRFVHDLFERVSKRDETPTSVAWGVPDLG